MRWGKRYAVWQICSKKLAACFFGVIAPALSYAPRSVQAQTWLSEPPVDIHGFVSQGFLKTTHNNYLAETEGGSFEFTEVGLNVTKVITDQLRVGVQLFSRDLGPIGNYRPQVDWFYLDYRFWDWLGLRAGRTKLPFGLLNEVNDIDAARVPALLPQSIYPTENRDYLLAQTGLELYGYVPLGAPGSLEYRLYGGTIFVDLSDNPAVADSDIPYVVGGRLMWLTPLETLQVGGSLQALEVHGHVFLPPAELAAYQQLNLLPADFAGTVELRMPVVLWVASAEYAPGNLYLATEYSSWIANGKTTPRILTREQSHIVSERFYVMGSYRVNSWFTPGIYYSMLVPNVALRSGPDTYQHDLAVTLRYDLTSNWLLKTEFHAMSGRAALSTSLNADRPRADLSSNWGLFVLKTTAHF